MSMLKLSFSPFVTASKEEYDEVRLADLHSAKPGSGFGTAVMRLMVQMNMSKLCTKPGNFTLEAAYKSHVFYLYMGMIPKNKKINFFTYLQYRYGMHEGLRDVYGDWLWLHYSCWSPLNPSHFQVGIQELIESSRSDNNLNLCPLDVNSAFRALRECTDEKGLRKSGYGNTLKIITYLELKKIKGTNEIDPQSVTYKTVLELREQLLSLKYDASGKEKQYYDYVRDVYFPNLVGYIQKYHIESKEIYPDSKQIDYTDTHRHTEFFGPVQMELSAQGKERWVHAIKNDFEFKTFGQLEPFQALLSPEQQEQLQNLLVKMNKRTPPPDAEVERPKRCNPCSFFNNLGTQISTSLGIFTQRTMKVQ